MNDKDKEFCNRLAGLLDEFEIDITVMTMPVGTNMHDTLEFDNCYGDTIMGFNKSYIDGEDIRRKMSK
jgi:hypothetical protein